MVRLIAPRLPGRLVFAAGVAMAVAASGCHSKATGYGGKFTFAYASGVEVENFMKPLAPGAKLEVVAFANGTEDELVITKATSSKPGVIAIDSVKDHTVVLKGIEPGVADLEFTARDKEGNLVVDKIFMHVARPTVHPLEHACTDATDAVYVRGEGVNVFHGLATSDGRHVIGTDYAPVRVEPARALELIGQPQDSSVYMYRANAKAEKVSVRSTVDGSTITLRVVERGDLEEATLACAGDCRVVEGRSQYVVARVKMGETTVCSQNALTKARSLTPEVCTVSANLDDEEGVDSNREQLAVVKGVKFGLCKFEVTLPELDGGKGVRLAGSAKIGRLEFPNDQGRSEGWPLHERNAAACMLLAVGWTVPKLVALLLVAISSLRLRARRASDLE